jgi:hypothetical protein
MSLYGSFPVSLINIMALLISFCYQRAEEVFVGKSLQALLSGLRIDIMLALARIDIRVDI